jgi:hypothetical protein
VASGCLDLVDFLGRPVHCLGHVAHSRAVSEQGIDTVVFLLILTLAYGGLQAYVMAKIVRAWGWRGGRRLAAWAWAAGMTAAPLLLWQLEHCDCRLLGAAFAGLTYGWMGLAFLFFWPALALDTWRWLARRWGWPSPDARRAFHLAGVLTLGLAGYGLWAAQKPRVERLEIVTEQLPPGLGRLRIVQVSDLHLGAMMGPRRLPPILDQVRALDPDLLVSTGDLVDGGAQHLEGLAGRFAAIRPRYGKYAVTGNHEYLMGLEAALAFHAQAGFRVLRDEAVAAAPGLLVAGVDDPGRHRPGSAERGRPAPSDGGPLLFRLPRDRFVLFLKHEPLLPAEGRAHLDLQLSGHTHAGQLFPFHWLVQLRYPQLAGLHPLPGGGRLYVSRGTGTWGPPLRVLAPAEITVIELVPRGRGA